MKFRRSKPTPAALPPPPMPAASTSLPFIDATSTLVPNPAPLRSALEGLDRAYADVAEFRSTMVKWEEGLKWAKENLNPEIEADLVEMRSYRDRVEMAPYHLRRAEAQIPVALDALLTATRTFDLDLVAFGKAEHAAMLQAIAAKVEPALASILEAYRMNPGAVAAQVAGGFAGLRHIPQSAVVLQDNTDADYLAGLQEPRYFCRPEVWLNTRGEAQPAAVQNLADFERILRSRAAALLAAFGVYEANGGTWLPSDFDEREPLFTVKENTFGAPATYKFSGTPASSSDVAPVDLGNLALIGGGSLGGHSRRDDAPPPSSLGGYRKGPASTRAMVDPPADAKEAAGARALATVPAPVLSADGTPQVDLQRLSLGGSLRPIDD